MLRISTLKDSEFIPFLRTLAKEDWYVEKLHIESLYKEFHEDFFIAYRDNSLVGVISALRYTENFGFISNFVILKKFRFQGFGKQLFEHALKHLGSRQIALECKKNQEKMYRGYGFQTYYQVKYFKSLRGSQIDDSMPTNIQTTNKHNAHTLFAYNKEMISSKFAKYMNHIVKNPQTTFQAIYKDSMLHAYGLCTVYKDGYKLVIESKSMEEAHALFLKLIEKIEVSTPIYIEIADTEKHLLGLVDLLKMEEDSTLQRMYNKIL